MTEIDTAAARAQAQDQLRFKQAREMGARSHPSDALKGGILLVGSILGGIMCAIVIWRGDPDLDGSKARAAREADDRARLECRQAGRSYEDFRSQGWHCVPEVK